MKKYIVTGMTCSACQAHVEKAVSAVPGVKSVAVSLLTNSMGVEGNASDEAIEEAVEKAGYGARPLEAEKKSGAAAPRRRRGIKGQGNSETETPAVAVHYFSSAPYVHNYGT